MTVEVFTVHVEGVGAFECPAGVTILKAMERAGGRHLGVGCRGGACGICRVRVTSGRYLTGAMSSTRVSAVERVTGLALACRLTPLGDLAVQRAWPNGEGETADAAHPTKQSGS